MSNSELIGALTHLEEKGVTIECGLSLAALSALPWDWQLQPRQQICGGIQAQKCSRNHLSSNLAMWRECMTDSQMLVTLYRLVLTSRQIFNSKRISWTSIWPA